MASNQSLTYILRWLYDRLSTGLNSDGSIFNLPGTVVGTPIAGALSATTLGAALSGTSVPCKGVLVFPTDAAADVYVGDETSQPARIPGIGVFIPSKNVNLLFGKLSTGTGTIPWIAIT